MACFMSVSIHFGQYNCCVYIWYSLAPSHSRARERARVNHLALLHLCTCFNHFNLKHKRMYLSINVIIEYNHFARANKEQENSHSTHSFRCVLYLAPIFVWVLDAQKNYICVIRLRYEILSCTSLFHLLTKRFWNSIFFNALLQPSTIDQWMIQYKCTKSHFAIKKQLFAFLIHF